MYLCENLVKGLGRQVNGNDAEVAVGRCALLLNSDKTIPKGVGAATNAFRRISLLVALACRIASSPA